MQSKGLKKGLERKYEQDIEDLVGIIICSHCLQSFSVCYDRYFFRRCTDRCNIPTIKREA